MDGDAAAAAAASEERVATISTEMEPIDSPSNNKVLLNSREHKDECMGSVCAAHGPWSLLTLQWLNLTFSNVSSWQRTSGLGNPCCISTAHFSRQFSSAVIVCGVLVNRAALPCQRHEERVANNKLKVVV